MEALDQRSPAPSQVTLGGYASPVTAARLLTVLFTLGACLNVAGVISTLAAIDLLQTAGRGEQVSEAVASASDDRQQFIATLQLTAYLPSVLVFLLWIDRVYANVSLLCPLKPSFGQRWAVGAWFVPLLNLVRPFQIVREAWWISSSPGQAMLAPPGFTPPTPPWLYAWWAMFIGSGLTGRLAAMSMQRATSIRDYVLASRLSAVSDVVTGAAAVLAIIVVTRISTDQDRAARASTR